MVNDSYGGAGEKRVWRHWFRNSADHAGISKAAAGSCQVSLICIVGIRVCTAVVIARSDVKTST